MATKLVYCTLKDIYADAGLDTDTLSDCIKSAEKFTDAVCDLVNISDRDNLKQLMQYYVTPRCIDSIVDITEDTDLDHSDLVGKLAV